MTDLLGDTNIAEARRLIGRTRQQNTLRPKDEQLVAVLIIGKFGVGTANKKSVVIGIAPLSSASEGNALTLGVVVLEEILDDTKYRPTFWSRQTAPDSLDIVYFTIGLGVARRKQQAELVVIAPDVADRAGAALVISTAKLVVRATGGRARTKILVVKRGLRLDVDSAGDGVRVLIGAQRLADL